MQGYIIFDSLTNLLYNKGMLELSLRKDNCISGSYWISYRGNLVHAIPFWNTYFAYYNNGPELWETIYSLNWSVPLTAVKNLIKDKISYIDAYK